MNMIVNKKLFSSREDPLQRVGIYESELNNPEFKFTITNEPAVKGNLYKIYPEVILNNYELQEIEISGKIHKKYEIYFSDAIMITQEFEDSNIDRLTIRDIYSIIHNKPVSNKKWLNELINQK